jgi:5-enolpyruvylshikimate-3-phosphate synthase
MAAACLAAGAGALAIDHASAIDVSFPEFLRAFRAAQS